MSLRMIEIWLMFDCVIVCLFFVWERDIFVVLVFSLDVDWIVIVYSDLIELWDLMDWLFCKEV